VCIDEAHCLSEWSHNFRPAYLRVHDMLKRRFAPGAAVIALTATAAKQTIRSICDALALTRIVRCDGVESPDALSQAPQVQRRNLQLSSSFENDPTTALLGLLQRPPYRQMNSIIVYVWMKWVAEHTARHLQKAGISVATYHADMLPEERYTAQAAFMSGEIRVVVATIAFGMGLDKEDIRAVIHLNMPKSLENYVQETGRAARDGGPGYCHTFLKKEDFLHQRRLVFAERVEDQEVRAVLRECLEPPEGQRIGGLGDLPTGGDIAVFRPFARFFDEKIQASKMNCRTPELQTIFAILEKVASQPGNIRVFFSFPGTLKLRFYSMAADELGRKDPFVNLLLHSGTNAAKELASHRSGCYTVSTVRAMQRSGYRVREFFGELSKAASGHFTIERCEYGILTMLTQPEDCDAVIDRVVTRLRGVEETNAQRLDACFAALRSVACSRDRLAVGNPFQLHEAIDRYFAASPEEDLVKIVAGDLDPNFLLADVVDDPAPPGVAHPAYATVFGDVLRLIQHDFYSQSDTVSNRLITKIFQGIASPNYPAKFWNKHPLWGRHKDKQFETLLALVEAARGRVHAHLARTKSAGSR